MLDIVYLNSCRRSFRKCIRRGKDIVKLEAVVNILVQGDKLPLKHRDHKLTGNFESCRECHIEPDWLLIYRVEGDMLILIDTGSHADLFG